MQVTNIPSRMGFEFEPVVHEITAEMIKEYASASFDFNPLHLDESWMANAEFGRTQFKSVIAHGLMMYSYVATMITQTVYPAGGWHERCEMRFKAPVFPGDTVTTRGKVTQVREMDDFILYEADVSIENQEGKTVQQGTAYGRLPLTPEDTTIQSAR